MQNIKQNTKIIKGFKEIVDKYDGFIFDVYGCLFDGQTLFQNTRDLLINLKEANKKSVILSNSPRLKDNLNIFLQMLGIERSLYCDVHSSGEQCYQFLYKLNQNNKSPKILVDDDNMLNALNTKLFQNNSQQSQVQFVKNYTDMEYFILSAAISQKDQKQYNKNIEILNIALENKVTLVIPNPDKIGLIKNEVMICPGTFGEIYEQKGGKVIYFGKPHLEVYCSIYDNYFQGFEKKKLIMIGDSLHTDIQGAKNFEIDSMLLLSGIHQKDVNLSNPQEYLDQQIQIMVHRNGNVQPNYILDQLRF